ncbi:MAG TPA: 4-(cytidine 5'-diphospho)-2-C-methyl-D-erythritol kinase [Sphingomonas sp.]|nr:4-(cytidine 5'-diphospho)-2-C-methyl-D-erythritol kinase [Sphingomonas sp.]
MAAVVEAAPAKINLALHVRRRRPDGYHAIETLFAFLRDGDVLSVELAERDRFAVTGPFASALAGQNDNLVLAARAAFAREIAPLPPLAITLDKRLPVASGIGGGSADAAAMLRVAARIAGLGADDPRLAACAAALGADVPACLHGRTAFGRGTGIELTFADGIGGTPVLLVNPGVAVSTAAAFRDWDGVDRGALGSGDPLAVARTGRNDLEPPARRLVPAIDAVLERLADAPGAKLVRMSGSGATCFALFKTEAARSAAAAGLRESRPDWWLLESTLA